MGQSKGFTILLWNGKYGSASNFVVKNNVSNKQTFFTPGNTKDITWSDQDLTKSGEVKGWKDFGNEIVDNLEDVVF